MGEDVGLNKTNEEYLEIKKRVDKEAFELLEEFVKKAEGISSGGQRFEILG
jgi:hypothetical protein